MDIIGTRAALIAILLTSPLLTATTSRADDVGCRGSVCVKYRGDHNQYYLHIRANMEKSHYNFRSPCVNRGSQLEIDRYGEYRFAGTAECKVSIQACKRENIPFVGTTKSRCGAWGTWTLRAASSPTIHNQVICKAGFCAKVTIRSTPPAYGSPTTYQILGHMQKWPRSNHRNIRCANGAQSEQKDNTWLNCDGTHFSVQACNRATFGSSKCTKWQVIP